METAKLRTDQMATYYRDFSGRGTYDIESIYSVFSASVWPDETSYLIDGPSAELIPIINENLTVRDRYVELTKFENLYDHIARDQEDRLLDFFSNMLIRYGTQPDLVSLDSVYGFIYRTQKGRILHKRTGIAHLGDDNKILCTFGRVRDITDWVHPNQALRWYAIGPHAKRFFSLVNQLQEFEGILSTRELEILQLISKGYTSRQIADILSIAKNTVDTHRRTILRKLEVQGSIEAIRKAQDIGLLK